MSVFVALLLVLLCFVQGLYTPSPPYYIPITQKLNNYLAFSIFIALLSPAIMEYNNSKWRQGIDLNTPRLLNDLTEAVKSGIPLFKALEEAATRDYGPITKDLERAMVKFHLTTNFEESLNWLSTKLNRPSIRRMCTILIEANKTGGDIIDVLNTSTDMFTNLVEHKEERNSKTKPYIFIVYFGCVIFLIISWLLLVQFLGPLSVATAEYITDSTTIMSNMLDINFYKSILFWAAVMEAIFGGLVAGKISEGRASSGLIHMVFLLFITISFFNVFTL